jgi:hypothetical protein
VDRLERKVISIFLLQYDNKPSEIVIMVRTQISLSEAEYQWAKKSAKKLGISLAEILRRSLRAMLSFPSDKPWMKFAGSVESGNRNASQTIDDLIYGQKD